MHAEAGFAEQQAFGTAPHFQGQGPMMAPQVQAPLPPGHAPLLPSQAPDGYGDAEGWLPGDEALELEKRMRPREHGMTSSSILFVGALCFFLTGLALFICEWRANAIGVVGYKQHRGWGLFHVVGTKSQSHFEIMQFTCRAYGGLSIGGICNSPICAWYKLKCQVYLQLMWISYSAGVFMVLGMIVHAFCLYWTWKLTPRLIRWAATWWCVAVALEGGAMVLWLVYTEDLFATLGEKAIYPTPPVSASFVIAAVSLFGLITCCILTFVLMKIHPESEDDYDSDDDFSDSDDDIVGVPAKEFVEWSKGAAQMAVAHAEASKQPTQAAVPGHFAQWPQSIHAHGPAQPMGQPTQAVGSVATAWPQSPQYSGGPVPSAGETQMLTAMRQKKVTSSTGEADRDQEYCGGAAPVPSSDASTRAPDSTPTDTMMLAAMTRKKATSSTRTADEAAHLPS